ncbi:MAG TPA: serine/threonine-protein kinase, partial [Polyangium sp.]|nr:serine/threonine-protein kinase [Polyangium sp.]
MGSSDDHPTDRPIPVETGLDAFGPTAPGKNEPALSPGQLDLAETIAARTPTEGAERGSTAHAAIPTGTRIKHYEIIRKLGEGGMGAVFLARDTRLGRRVAIKFLHEQSGPAPERFLVEARATALCQHENIVIIYDVDEFDGKPYMVLEYIEGRTLFTAIQERRGGDNPTSKSAAHWAIEIMIPVVRALAAAHAMNIVHRDLKPENILLSNTGLVKVVDFGIAKQISGSLSLAITGGRRENLGGFKLTHDGATPGTIMYMSPEQWLNEGIDARTDIWAVGLILFELLVGEHPLSPVTLGSLAQVVDFNTPMPSACERRPDAAALGEIIDRCLMKRKKERYASALELCNALQSLLAKSGTPTPSEQECPFAGLSAFHEADAARYFGRERDTAAVVGKLRTHELLAIVGPSGAGKSSFVYAGVIPALKSAGRRLETCVIRPGRKPLSALVDALAVFGDSTADEARLDSAAIEERLLVQPGYLGARLRARCRRRGEAHRILLFVDQFEELYTLGIDPKVRLAFCASLLGVGDDASSPLRVILSMRADFLDRLSEDRTFLSEVTRGLYFLTPIGAEGQRDALVKPLEAANYQFENERLLEEIMSGLVGLKSPLPILQFLATKLWELRDKERRLLTTDAYRALGGVAGALSTHADAVLSAMSPTEQRITRAIFLRLVTPERTRAIVLFDELCVLSEDHATIEQVVQRLAEARLISIETGHEHDGKTVELVHESLIERWPLLGIWLDQANEFAKFRSRLRTAAKEWETSKQSEGLVWRGDVAEETRRFWRAHGNPSAAELNARETAYVMAVLDLQNRERRFRRRMVGAGFVALVLVVLVVSSLALQSRREAQRAQAGETEAQAQRNEAHAQKAAAERSAARARNVTRMAAAGHLQKDPLTMLALL